MAIMEVEALLHPTDEQLRDFGYGALPPDDAAVVEDHLAFCDSCCRLVENAPGDSFSDQLRAARRAPSVDTWIGLADATWIDEPGELANHPRYRVLKPLGRGGMGAVYLAEHRRMGRSVALKVINPEFLNQAGSLPRFQQEVKAAATLDHPNIVAAYDADQAGALHFLVMEYVEGQNLADFVSANGPLPIAQACDIVRQAALGLHHAHERGMVHRDIKPHNLMLTPAGQVKVLDFGLARLAAEPVAPPSHDDWNLAPAMTAAGAVMGSADYIAPEQARDAHSADGRSDIYSLGCTLYYLLTGSPPFPEGTAPEKLRRHNMDAPPRLNAQRADAPDKLARIVAKMLAKQPENRLQTAAEVAAELSVFTNTRPKQSKFRWILLVLAGLCVAAFAVAMAAGIVRLPAGPDREIVIETDDPDVEIVVKGDRVVRIVDPKTGRAYQLDRQDLTMSLFDDANGLSVVLGDRPVVLKRQGKRLGAVWLEQKPKSNRTTNGPRVHQIEVDVMHVQIERAEARRMLDRWLTNPPSSESKSSGSKIKFGVLTNPTGFFEDLKAMRVQGKARVASEPKVVTLNARPAQIVTGADIPIFTTTSGSEAPVVSYKTIGDTCTVLPIVLPNGKIHLEVAFATSALDAANSLKIDGAKTGWVPGFKTDGCQVAVQLEDGQSLVIGGFSQPEAKASKDLPKEKMILVTPRIVSASDKATSAAAKAAAIPRPFSGRQEIELDLTHVKIASEEGTGLLARWMPNSKSETSGILADRDGFFKDLGKVRERKRATISAEPIIVTPDGKPAQFETGRYVPVVTSSPQGGDSVDHKLIGTIVTVHPTILASGKIRIDLSFSDTAPAPMNATATIPGFNSQGFQATFEMEAGQTYLLSGTSALKKVPENKREGKAGSDSNRPPDAKEPSDAMREYIVLLRPRLLSAVQR
jgi:Flp pilus assembly secretin CpaC